MSARRPRSRARLAPRPVWGLAATLVAIGLAGPAPNALAAPPPPLDLRVDGGEEVWSPQRSFRLLWKNPSTAGGPPIASAHYRVRDPAGTVVVGPVRIGWAATSVEGVEVPVAPGAYSGEVWLEDSAGEVGAPAAVKLRFDNVRPGDVEPLIGAAWLGRAAFPLPIRLSHPGGSAPLSGIRGYAVAISSAPGPAPCAAADRCTEAETDLRGGAAADTYVVHDLPEGTSHLSAVAVSGSGMASVAVGGASLRVDKTSPATKLSGAPEGWINGAATLTASATDHGSGMVAADGGPPPFTAISIDGATPIAAPGASVTATVLGEGVHEVAYYARDLAGNVDDGGSDNGVLNPPPRTAVVRIDRTPPAVSFLNAPEPGRPELIAARVADPLSGAAGGRGWIGVRARGSGDRFVALPRAQAPRGELRAHWDSDAYAPGEYEFRAVGYDAAGNVAATRLRANGGEMVLASPLKGATILQAGFGAAAALPRRTVAYGRGALLSGRLLGRSRPLGSMQVRIVERFGPSAGLPDRVTTVTTAADGGFALRLAPGPSREVTAAFPGTPALSRAASGAMVLGVRGGVRLRASAATAKVGGAPLVFRGRVAAARGAIPPQGKSVQLQFRLAGGSWREFRTIRTDRRGRFRYRYRFSDDDSRGVRFLFRAYAPPQGDWPYEPAGSRPVAVRGR